MDNVLNVTQATAAIDPAPGAMLTIPAKNIHAVLMDHMNAKLSAAAAPGLDPDAIVELLTDVKKIREALYEWDRNQHLR